MKMRFKRMCRGCGVAYIEAVVSGHTADDIISFSAKSETGVPIPIESYQNVGVEGEETSFILATPLLDTKKIKVKASTLSSNGKKNQTKCATRSISRFALKWLSRLNYKLNFEKTSAIRDADLVVYSDQVHVYQTVTSTTEDSTELIIKGYACAPASNSEIKFTLLGSDGSHIQPSRFIVGRTISTRAHGLNRIETSFTLRIPNDNSTRCLVAYTPEAAHSGFLCFDPDSRNRFLGNSPAMLFLTPPHDDYSRFAARRLRLINSLKASDFDRSTRLKFSIVIPLFNTPVALLQKVIHSIENQIYQNWELILVNSTPQNSELSFALSVLTDPRIKVIELSENLGISGNTNIGISHATGDFIAFADHDDELDRFALISYAQEIERDPTIDALYSDEDLIDPEGNYILPNIKPDFSIDLLRCHNYITHFVAVRANLVKELPLNRELDGAQDYDFLLRLSERTQQITHVPDILYHWRMSETSSVNVADNKSYAGEAGRTALQNHLNRQGLDAVAELTSTPFVYHVTYNVNDQPLVSILIPNKDNLETLKRCVDSILEKTEYQNFEVIIIENNSTESKTFEYYHSVTVQYDKVRVLTWEGTFNYSAINNYAARFAQGDYLLLLNNDTEIIESDWLRSMLSFAQRNDVGAVGAKLLYPDDTIQHAGVVILPSNDLNSVAGPVHVFNHLDQNHGGYMGRTCRTQDLSCVTAACMMVKKSVFDRVRGFDEEFVVAYNDIDLCLRIRELGLLVVYDPDALLYHYESVSRGFDTTGEKRTRFIREQSLLRSRWAKYYSEGDPYYHPFDFVYDGRVGNL